VAPLSIPPIGAAQHIPNRRRLIARPQHERHDRGNQAERQENGPSCKRDARAKRKESNDDQDHRSKPDLDQFRASEVLQHDNHPISVCRLHAAARALMSSGQALWSP